MIAPTIRHRNAARGRDDRALATIVSVVALASLPAIVHVVRTIPLRVSLDANEGWNAYHAVAAFGADSTRAGRSSSSTTNPPLSFYLVGAAGRWIGDPIVAGRLVASLAFAMLVAIALWSRRGRCSARAARPRSRRCCSSRHALAEPLRRIDDPSFSVRRSRQQVSYADSAAANRAAAVRAAALMSMPSSSSTTPVALRFACAAWLWTHESDRAARRFAIAGISFAIVGFSLSLLLWRSGLSRRPGDAPWRTRSARRARAFVRWISSAVFMVALLVLLRRFPDDPYIAFCACTPAYLP